MHELAPTYKNHRKNYLQVKKDSLFFPKITDVHVYSKYDGRSIIIDGKTYIKSDCTNFDSRIFEQLLLKVVCNKYVAGIMNHLFCVICFKDVIYKKLVLGLKNTLYTLLKEKRINIAILINV